MDFNKPIVHSQLENYSDELKQAILSRANDYEFLRMIMEEHENANPDYDGAFEDIINEIHRILKFEDKCDLYY